MNHPLGTRVPLTTSLSFDMQQDQSVVNLHVGQEVYALPITLARQLGVLLLHTAAQADEDERYVAALRAAVGAEQALEFLRDIYARRREASRQIAETLFGPQVAAQPVVSDDASV